MNNSIAFITCVTDDLEYNECISYINNLNMPDGFEKEIIAVRNSKSMASGYNDAMKKSNSKYKVYLHQDTMIINKNFIYDILDVFQNKEIGMMGVIGCEKLPADAVWWDSRNQCGKIYESSTGYIRLDDKTTASDRETKEVQAIDGLIMITQYDVEWRDDIFDGYDLYDLSQCMEFYRKNLKVIIPFQNEPWCIHDCKTSNFDKYISYKNKFLDEYSKDVYPLVSILIPTYNRLDLFIKALNSVINQTYRNIEIIICDDSTNDDIENYMSKFLNKYSNVYYYRNTKNLGQFDNDLKLMSLAKGRYINFLMDDDLFEQSKIEKMMNYFIFDKDNEISLVSSDRKLIEYDGQYICNFISDIVEFKEAKSLCCGKPIDGKLLSEFVIYYNSNIIGEPTTVLFDKTMLSEDFGVFNSRKYICNVDQATWHDLLSNGKGVIIKEALSSFRVSEDQQSNNLDMIIGGMKDYVFTISKLKENGYFVDDIERYAATKLCLDYIGNVKRKYGSIESVLEAENKLNELLRDIVVSADV